MKKLGSATGSLVNYININDRDTTVPEVGMGVTFYHWSDRTAGTIQEINEIRGRTYIGITGDEATRIDDNGFSECQDYTFTQHPDRPLSWYRRPQDGLDWESVRLNPDTGRWGKSGNSSIRIGHRDHYYDFSF